MKKFILIFVGVLLFVTVMSSVKDEAYAYGECDEYGVMATYESYSNSCKCMSGYVFGKNVLGESYCISGDTMCNDKYGYNSRYDYLSNSCECSYGYIFGKDSIGRTQCVSPDSVCKDQLGYGARYNSLYDKCECGYGDVISNGQCTDGDIVCHSKHGYNSDYDDLSNACECNDGYTFDDSNQCVEKQNNVYFTLKELDTDSKLAIIKSDYDYKYYLVSYSVGCYATSFRRYLNKQIVVNLGTDFYVDRWDRIVLPDDDEVCDIRSVEKIDSFFTLEPETEEDIGYYYTPPAPQSQTSVAPTAPTQPTTIKTVKQPKPQVVEELEKETSTTTIEKVADLSTTTEIANNLNKETSFVSKIISLLKNIFNF